VRPGVRRAGLPRLSPPLTPGQRRAGARRLDLNTAEFGNETVYRKQIRPVMLEGADVMDRIFPDEKPGT
jgi:hypothetical protein